MRPHFLELSGKSGICIAFFFFLREFGGKVGIFLFISSCCESRGFNVVI